MYSYIRCLKCEVCPSFYEHTTSDFFMMGEAHTHFFAPRSLAFELWHWVTNQAYLIG